ncbi:uncharacterized protein LOC141701008 [Apium graveolens]|uniref:uncharacterized protein LOC141701008 n=1 Tax=Apium graveolens TaxID=4045 RepID=UPI003D7A3F66
MSCISWNCHGLGNLWAVQFLTKIVLQKKPNIIFLSEILCKKDRVRIVKNILGFEGAVTVERQGNSGGLDLIWRNKEEVNPKSFSKHYIDTEVSVQGWDKFRLTGLYGEPYRANRRFTWDLIRHLHQISQLPWCIICDMNNTLNHEDKRGGHQYPNWLLQGFRQAVEDCDLVDMDIKGYQFTWEKSYGRNDWIEVRLDRALVSYNFMNCFKNAQLTNLEITTSNHSPIMIEPVIIFNIVPSKRFRFENAWLRELISTKIRRKTNTIHSLLDSNGQFVSWNSETEWESVIECVDWGITEEQNLELLMPVEDEEVKRALFSMHPEKSPGPDGMSPCFYQKYWNTLGKDLTSLVKIFFDTASLDCHLTDTNIVLIPKKKCPIQMDDLRPISLCNVAYKVISKLLANRLNRVINGIKN